jgi:putative component of toxin-antitoxin plasmid stabilization module
VPQTEVYFYQDERGRVPVVEWLTELRQSDRRAYAKCVARIRRLAEAGHELRRPEADFLRDGVYELRARQGHVNYRILYFFHGRNVAILVCALTKEGEIPEADIDRALRRKETFEQDPERHTYEEENNG